MLSSHQSLRLGSPQTQIDHQVLDRQTVNAVLELPKPGHKLRTPLRRHARSLVRQIRPDVSVGKNRFARRQRRLQFCFGFEAVPGVKQRGEVRIHRLEFPEFAIQEAGDQLPERRFIARES